MLRLSKAGTGGTGDERGVVAPLVALLMTAMMGMAALAIDTAMLYAEKAQLQNGADAAALAIAHSCAGVLDTATKPETCQKDLDNANRITGANALDGFTEVTNSKYEKGVTDVEVQSLDTAEKKYFSLVFARVLGIDAVDIRASAQAKLEGYKSSHVLPMAFSKCESDPGLTRAIWFFPMHGSTISRQTDRTCKPKNFSGSEVAGGFGFLDDNVQDGQCSLHVSAEVDVKNMYDGDTGGNLPMDCKTKFQEIQAILSAGKSFDVLVPIFHDVTGTGSNAVFYIEAFAQISLRGWHFGNGFSYLTSDAQAESTRLGLRNPDHGLFGKFIKKVSWADASVLGGLNIYHAGGIRLTN